jgi:small neutral amino acid transporter SnatA (MarC family)
MNSVETFLCTLCAVSFASTLVLLLLSILQRLAPAAKVRLMQMAFSFSLTAVVVFALART